MTATRMPWGKFRGEPITEVPLGYLAWVLEHCQIPPGLRRAIVTEVASRLDLEPPVLPPPPPGPVPPALRPVARDLVRAGFRALAQRSHPDHGGSNEAMRAVVDARAALERVVA